MQTLCIFNLFIVLTGLVLSLAQITCLIHVIIASIVIADLTPHFVATTLFPGQDPDYLTEYRYSVKRVALR